MFGENRRVEAVSKEDLPNVDAVMNLNSVEGTSITLGIATTPSTGKEVPTLGIVCSDLSDYDILDHDVAVTWAFEEASVLDEIIDALVRLRRECFGPRDTKPEGV